MKKIALLAFVALLSSCKEAPLAYTPEPFTFEQSQPIRVNVARINVVEDYQSSARKPNVEQDFPVPPAAALKQWAQKRLQANGSNGVMEIVIKDASVKEVTLQKTEGVKGFFTNDPEARYDGHLLVTIRVFSGTQAISDATADVEVTRSRSINEKATAQDREKFFHQLTRDMLMTFDSEAQNRLRQYFPRYLN